MISLWNLQNVKTLINGFHKYHFLLTSRLLFWIRNWAFDKSFWKNEGTPFEYVPHTYATFLEYMNCKSVCQGISQSQSQANVFVSVLFLYCLPWYNLERPIKSFFSGLGSKIELRPSIGSLEFWLGSLENSPDRPRSRSKMLKKKLLDLCSNRKMIKIFCSRSLGSNLNARNAHSKIEIRTYSGKIEKFCAFGL